MQAIKDKLSDLNAMRKAKSEAKEEEKAERELAKARMEVAHEIRMAREAEAAMDLHVNKAAQKADELARRNHHPVHGGAASHVTSPYGRNPSSPPSEYSSPTASTPTGGPPINNNLL